MKKLLLYSLTLVGMLVSSTQSAVAQGTTLAEPKICTFETSGPTNKTDFTFTYSKYSKLTCLEAPKIDGTSYTLGWKVESSSSVAFETENKALLKLVLVNRTGSSYTDAKNYSIKIDDTKNTDLTKPGTLYVELEAGHHKIARGGGESCIAYIGVFENYSTISNEISTMYYEYPVSLADGLTAYTGTVNGNSVSLTAIEGNVVKKETPVIVKAAAAGTYYINESNVVGAGEAGSLSGTATALTVGSNTYYTLGHKDGDANAEIGFYKFSGTTIPANKAYIDGATVSGAPKFLSIEGDGNTTGIHDTMIDNADVDAPMFNIAGQRVGNNAKGLVIKNGKKYMLK